MTPFHICVCFITVVDRVTRSSLKLWLRYYYTLIVCGHTHSRGSYWKIGHEYSVFGLGRIESRSWDQFPPTQDSQFEVSSFTL